MNPIVKFKRLHKDAILPAYQTAGAAGMDLHWDGRVGGADWLAGREDYRHAALDVDLAPMLFCTGLCVEIPEGFEGQIRPRSSLGKYGVHVFFGTIDNDYRGELKVRMMLLAGERGDTHRLQKGDRIAQLIIAPVSRATIVEAEELSETARGAGGFGSTGK